MLFAGAIDKQKDKGKKISVKIKSKANRRQCCFCSIKAHTEAFKVKANAGMDSSHIIMGNITANAKVLMCVRRLGSH